VRGRKRIVVGMGDLGDMGGKGDQRSRSSWEGRSLSKANAILRRPPGPSQPKMARPALKAALEGERTGASSMSKQPLGHQMVKSVSLGDQGRASMWRRPFHINQAYNPFDDEVPHTEELPWRVGLSESIRWPNLQVLPRRLELKSNVFDLGSSSSEESEEEEVEKKEAANIERDEESRRENDSDVVFVEHTSNANVGFNRESIVAKLKRNGNVTVGGQLVKLPVPMRKKTLEINQWQDWLTLEEQVWKEADTREQGSPLRKADQEWLRSFDRKMRKVLSKKKKHL